MKKGIVMNFHSDLTIEGRVILDRQRRLLYDYVVELHALDEVLLPALEKKMSTLVAFYDGSSSVTFRESVAAEIKEITDEMRRLRARKIVVVGQIIRGLEK